MFSTVDDIISSRGIPFSTVKGYNLVLWSVEDAQYHGGYHQCRIFCTVIGYHQHFGHIISTVRDNISTLGMSSVL